MARFRWTEEAIAELRRQMNLEKTYAQIAKLLGCSENGVRIKVSRLGWGGRIGYLASRRMKGKKRPLSVRLKIAKASKARTSTPEHRERFRQAVGSPEIEAKRLAALTAHYDARRGGPLSPHLREAYALARSQHFSAREAYAVAISSDRQKGSDHVARKA
ncbi:hypothetical protein [Aureimonas psammosilenae]|uniref:hypothetical protein n=1 Tax=Aureimonas psammosilenae TaxID=2495496 RepID=UPI0012611BC3|nr:hypothetical protein [Aureimonas psammosilenae]